MQPVGERATDHLVDRFTDDVRGPRVRVGQPTRVGDEEDPGWRRVGNEPESLFAVAQRVLDEPQR